jgi:hypothetical protein
MDAIGAVDQFGTFHPFPSVSIRHTSPSFRDQQAHRHPLFWAAQTPNLTSIPATVGKLE